MAKLKQNIQIQEDLGADLDKSSPVGDSQEVLALKADVKVLEEKIQILWNAIVKMGKEKLLV
jgi:hypothetical protein